MQIQVVIPIVPAFLATLGWVTTTRRARLLARKQFTITTILQADFSAAFQADLQKIRCYMLDKSFPIDKMKSDETDWAAARRVLNFYEFLAAGISRGYFEEETIRRVEGHRTLRLCDTFREVFIAEREALENFTIWEHMDWIEDRWRITELSFGERLLEWLQERPIPVAIGSNVYKEKNLTKETALQRLFFRFGSARRRENLSGKHLPEPPRPISLSWTLIVVALTVFFGILWWLERRYDSSANSSFQETSPSHALPVVNIGPLSLPCFRNDDPDQPAPAIKGLSSRCSKW